MRIWSILHFRVKWASSKIIYMRQSRIKYNLFACSCWGRTINQLYFKLMTRWRHIAFLFLSGDFWKRSVNIHRFSRVIEILLSFWCHWLAIGRVKVSSRYVFPKLSPPVPRWIIPSNNINAFKIAFCAFSSTDSKQLASFPHHLREMTCSRGIVVVIEVIPGPNTDLIVPRKILWSINQLNNRSSN